MSDQINFGQVRPLDSDGAVSPGAKAYFYEPGTTTPKTVYSDSAMTTAHASPLVADASGQFDQVFSNGGVKVVVTDADDVTLPGYPLDPAFTSQGDQSSASNISFNPTEDIATDNVQDAIESVRADMGDITDAGRALIDDADAAAQRTTLELENVAKTSPVYTDANDITESGFSFLQSTAANIPTAARYHIYTAQRGADYIAQIAVRSSITPEMYQRYSLYGVWGDWVRMARADEVLGIDQTLQDVSASRAVGTFYQNTFSKPIFVIIAGWTDSSELTTFKVGPSMADLRPAGSAGNSGSWRQNVSAIIPPGWWYRLPSGTFVDWSEVR